MAAQGGGGGGGGKIKPQVTGIYFSEKRGKSKLSKPLPLLMLGRI